MQTDDRVSETQSFGEPAREQQKQKQTQQLSGERSHMLLSVCVCVLSWVNYFVCVCVAWGAKTNCAHRIRFSIVPNMLEEGSSHILLSLSFSLTDLFRAVKNVFKSRRSNVVVACGGVQLDYF